MDIYQLSVRPRHRRYMFFIAEAYLYKDLYQLIVNNLTIWGGRYNPIIPVLRDGISEAYIDLIKHYDPDIIFYSSNVDLEMLKELRLFNPSKYVNLDDKPREENVSGVDTFFFLTEFENKAKVILPEKFLPSEDVLPTFYEMNYGLSDTPLHHQYEMSKNYVQILINREFADINKIIHVEKPINFAALSKYNINTRVLRNLEHANFGDFELVVARDESQIGDLLYYWNRGLYENKNVMYVTLEQLSILSKDKFFGGMLYDQKGEESIRVVSTSLEKGELEEVIANMLQPIAYHSNFRYYDISAFPYKVLDSNGLYERNFGESATSQTLISDTGLLHIPKLSFGGVPKFLALNYAVDIKISQDNARSQKAVLFPFTTQSMYIVKDVPGRVLRSRNLSVFVNSQRQQSDVFRVTIPAFSELVKQLIQRPVIYGESIDTKIIHVGPNDASNRLKAFISAFKGNLEEIYTYFSDKFWVDIFEELILSQAIAGDSLTFEEILNKALEMYEMQKLNFVDRKIGWFNVDNLKLGLKRTLTNLTEYQVFFKGFKLKCTNCSSSFWYHVNEVKDIISCRGCLEDFDLPVEPCFSYKLNDLIKNNIYATTKDRDGNLTVIRALSAFGHTARSFQYSPQLNLYDDFHSKKPFGDLDIVINDGGKFIIGEAKHDSKGFFEDDMKSLRSLVAVSAMIFPDKILLVASADDKNKLEKAEKSLLRLLKGSKFKPEVETMLLAKPDYWHIKSHRYFKY